MDEHLSRISFHMFYVREVKGWGFPEVEVDDDEMHLFYILTSLAWVMSTAFTLQRDVPALTDLHFILTSHLTTYCMY